MVIHDGLPAHKSKIVKELIKKYKGKIKVYLLPSYNPDLNPVEMIWSIFKKYVHSAGCKIKNELIEEVTRAGNRQRQRKAMNINCFLKTTKCSAK